MKKLFVVRELCATYLLVLLFACAKAPANGNSLSPANDSKKTMFVVEGVTGDLGGGISGADSICSANLPTGVDNAKALLVDGVQRVACTTANCTGGTSEHNDWVLSPNTEYIAEDFTLIGKTNSIGLLPSTEGFAGSQIHIWSGLTFDWRSAANHCSGWTTDSSGTGSIGLSDSGGGAASSSFWASGSNDACSSLNSIVCVEQ